MIGYAGGVLRGEGDFYDIVEAVSQDHTPLPPSRVLQRRCADSSKVTKHIDKPLRLFVYNADYDVTREAILVPNRYWGGDGLLGCGVGFGLLHRIPRPQDRVQRHQIEAAYESPPRAGRRAAAAQSDEYAPVGYEDPQGFAGFAASEGVEIVANEAEEETSFTVDHYARAAPAPSALASSSRG